MISRTPASSPDELAARWGSSLTENGQGIPDGAPYSTATVFSKDAPITKTLNAAIRALRNDYEIEDIFAASHGDAALEPLQNRHFVAKGAWAMVLRKRHPTQDPRIVGIMMAKDEADVIPDVMHGLLSSTPHGQGLDALYFCAQDQPTYDAIMAAAPHAVSVPVPDGVKASDGHRQLMLERVRADRGEDPRRTWVMVVQGDEVYEPGDIRHHVRAAQLERTNVMNAQVATFVLHESQRAWTPEAWKLESLKDRLTHYVWDFQEHAGFVDYPWVHYRSEEHMRAHPHGLYPGIWASAKPVRRHYPFRTPEQARARILDRLKSGWQPHYENYQDVFMGDEAAGRKIKRYWGWFGEAERVEGIW